MKMAIKEGLPKGYDALVYVQGERTLLTTPACFKIVTTNPVVLHWHWHYCRYKGKIMPLHMTVKDFNIAAKEARNVKLTAMVQQAKMEAPDPLGQRRQKDQL